MKYEKEEKMVPEATTKDAISRRINREPQVKDDKPPVRKKKEWERQVVFLSNDKREERGYTI